MSAVGKTFCNSNRVYKTFHGFCWDGLSHIDELKMMVCTLYMLLKPFFPLSYDFRMEPHRVCVLLTLLL